MHRYQANPTWLTWFAPFRTLSISAAYLTPFFLAHGLNLAQIFGLQALFSVACLLWELPSGFIADRIGRAFSIKLSAPIAGLTMIAYGFSTHYWQFVLGELGLALATGLISGVDTALLLDSLKADSHEKDFVRLSQRMNAAMFAATALGVPLAIVLVRYVSVSSTLVADGVLTLAGSLFALQLVEAPRYNGGQEALRRSAWHAIRQFWVQPDARWLMLLGAALSTTTYIGFWLSAPYYTSLGLPVVLFGLILALRNLWKAWLSHWIRQEQHIERNLAVYAALAGFGFVAMATGQPWLLWAVLMHDTVHALQTQPITAELNRNVEHEYRATINSLVNLFQRLSYCLAGPLVGLVVDKTSLGIGCLATGLCCSGLAFIALARLHSLGTFRERR